MCKIVVKFEARNSKLQINSKPEIRNVSLEFSDSDLFGASNLEFRIFTERW